MGRKEGRSKYVGNGLREGKVKEKKIWECFVCGTRRTDPCC